jgi:transposase-like protein
LRKIDPELNKKKFVLIKCPKCRKSRGGESKHQSWKCFGCGYSMNRKNTRIQWDLNSPEMIGEGRKILDKKKPYKEKEAKG